MKPSLLDRAIGYFDPQRAARRLKARGQIAIASDMLGAAQVSGSVGSGYSSTDVADPWAARWVTMPRDAASDTLPYLRSLSAQARELTRRQPLAASAINTNVLRAVGTGLAYSAQPHLKTLGWSADQGEEWRSHVQAEFSLWADSPFCDWLGVQTFYEKQDLVLRSMLESGDVFTLLPDARAESVRRTGMPYRLRVQTLEADRIGNPSISSSERKGAAGGVWRDPSDPYLVNYHLYDRHPGTMDPSGGNPLAGRWIEAIGPSGRRRMLHHFKLLRPDQPRGVPYLAPVMHLFKLLGDYSDAELKAAVVSAFLTVFIETEGGTQTAPVFGVADPVAGQPVGAGQVTPSGSAANQIELGPAAVIGLGRNEKATVTNPGRPNPAFGDFVDAVLDQLGAGTFIGREILVHRFSTSYVAARAAFLDAWKHFLDMRTLVWRSFCQPVLETWMAEAVAIGRVSAPGFFGDPRLRWAYTRAAWVGDSQGSINPKDEVAAYSAAVEAKLMTHQQAEWELFGSDWNDSYPVKLAEHKRLAEDGMLPPPKAGAAAPDRASRGGAEEGGQP